MWTYKKKTRISIKASNNNKATKKEYMKKRREWVYVTAIDAWLISQILILTRKTTSSRRSIHFLRKKIIKLNNWWDLMTQLNGHTRFSISIWFSCRSRPRWTNICCKVCRKCICESNKWICIWDRKSGDQKYSKSWILPFLVKPYPERIASLAKAKDKDWWRHWISRYF